MSNLASLCSCFAGGLPTFLLLLSRAGTRVKAGAEVRLLNIPADAGRGMGLFEDIHGAESPRVFAEELKARAARIYGTPLRAFLNHLVRDYDALLPQADSFMPGLVKG